MDRPTDELVQRMLAAVLEKFGGDEAIDHLVRSASNEAEAEVRELLKGAIKATLLQRAVSRLESRVSAGDAARGDTAAKGKLVGETGCYVYGITRAGSPDLPPEVPPVDPNAPLTLVRHDDVVAFTSDVSLAEFSAEAVSERVKDLDWVEQRVRAHDAVVKAMLAAGPVIPCRFCTILRSAHDVRRLLERNDSELRNTLDALDGTKEWGVKMHAAR